MTRFFDDFWLASELDAYNLPEFGQRITAFHGDDKPLRLDYPAAAPQGAVPPAGVLPGLGRCRAPQFPVGRGLVCCGAVRRRVAA